MGLEITTLTIKIMLILFPGIVTTKIVNRLTERKKENVGEFFIRAFVYGFITYMITYISLLIINFICKAFFYGFLNVSGKKDIINLEFYENILNIDENILIEYNNLLITTIFSIIFSFIISKIDNGGYLNKFAQKLKVTNKFSESDVWGNIFNNIDDIGWITIRDFEKNIMYQGWPRKFSSFHDDKELLLEEVKAFDNKTREELFYRELMYFEIKNNSNFTIEFEKDSEGEKNEYKTS